MATEQQTENCCMAWKARGSKKNRRAWRGVGLLSGGIRVIQQQWKLAPNDRRATGKTTVDQFELPRIHVWTIRCKCGMYTREYKGVNGP